MKMVQEKFENLIDEMGQTISWYKSFRCPCFDARSGEPDPSCASCSGKGQVYSAPVTCNIAFSGMDAQKDWVGYGRFETGDLVVTVGYNSQAYDLAEGDKIVLLDSSIPFETTGTTGAPVNLSHVVSIESPRLLVNGTVVIKSATWSEQNNLVWSSPAPNAGIPFTIKGRKNPVYTVYTDLARDRHHYHGAHYPRLVVLRVLDLVGR